MNVDSHFKKSDYLLKSLDKKNDWVRDNEAFLQKNS